MVAIAQVQNYHLYWSYVQLLQGEATPSSDKDSDPTINVYESSYLNCNILPISLLFIDFVW